MTFDEMLSFTVDGGQATCDLLQPDSYVDYQFDGWRINFQDGKGSSSGTSFRDGWKAAQWREYKKTGWAVYA